MNPSSTSRSAFTLLELLVVLAILAILVGILMPAGRGCKTKSSHVACMSNLKQVALGYIIWVHEHEQSAPPFRVGWWAGGSSPGPAGKTRPAATGPEPAWVKSGLANLSWFQFAWISNELVNPKILTCPSDRENNGHAENFSSNASGG